MEHNQQQQQQQQQSKTNKESHQQSTHEKNVKSNLLDSCQEQIIEIMEGESKIEIPLQAVQIALAVSFLQMIVYLFKDHKSILADGVKLEAAVKVVDMISVLNILNIAENDALSVLVYMILHGIMISAYLVILIKVIVFASVSNHGSSKYNKLNLRRILGKSDKFLNIFFSFFLPVLLNQYAELNCALLFCTPNSLTQSMRESSCSKSSWQIIFGVLGISLTVITAIVVSYFFRNHEFLDQNPFKGRFSILSTGIIAVRLFLTLFHFIDVNIGFKHVLAQTYGILSLANFLFILPFPGEEQLASRFLDIVAFYESAVICGNLLIWSGTIIDQEAFYLFLLLGSLLQVLLKQTFILRRELIMQGDLKQMSSTSTYSIYYYLESLMDMAVDSLKDVEQKVKLIRYLKLHKMKCTSIFCKCHSLNEARYTVEDIVDIVDNLFQEILHRSRRSSSGQWGAHSRESTSEFTEILLLKYISFIQKMNENFTKAYYELKIAGRRTTTGRGRNSQSMYCQLLCRVLARQIQAQIEIEETTTNEKLQRTNGLSSKSVNDFSVKSMIAVDKLCAQQLAKILNVIDKKIKLWQNLQKGYRTINNFQEEAIALTSLMRNVAIEFNASKKQLESSNSDVRNLFPFLKLTQLFNLLVKNDIPQAIKAEFHMLELKKREGTEVSEELKNSNIIKGEACVVEISLSEELGKIVSKKDSKLAGFFGYEDASEFSKVKHLQELMPGFIGSVHNDLLENYLDGESQRAKGAKQKTISAALMKDKNGFLNPITIQFEFSFLHPNDFRMQGVLLRQFSPSEYIVFGRNGRVLGISQGMVRILFRNSYASILSGEKAAMNLHALLLFPKIIRRIVDARDAILNDLETRKKGDEHSAGRIEGAISKRGSIKSTANPDKLFKKFQFYRSKLLKSINNNGSSREYKRQMSSAKNSSNHSETYKQFNEIDIISETSLELLDNFLGADLQSSAYDGNTSNGEGTERLKALSKSIGATMSVFKSNNTQTSQTIEYKTRFEYDLSYNLLSTEKEGPRRLKDIFFTLRMDNLETKIISKKKKLRGKEKFLQNLVVFFQASTSILPLSQFIDGQLPKQPGIPSMMSNNDNLFVQPDQAQRQSYISTQVMEQSWSSQPEERNNRHKLLEFQEIFPKKMVQMMLKQNSSQREIKQANQGDDDNEDTSQVSQEDDQSLDMEIMKDLLKQGKQKAGQQQQSQIIAGQLENKETLDAKLVQFGINDSILLIDPFYQVKQTVKHKLLSVRLAAAFDSSVTTMLLLLSEHKTSKNFAFQQKTKSKTLEDGLLLQSNRNSNNHSLTFRQSPRVNVNLASSPVAAQVGSNLNNKLTNIDEEMSVQAVYDDEEQGKAPVDSFSMEQQIQRNNLDNLNAYQLSLATQLEDIQQNNTQIYTVFDRLEMKDHANQGMMSRTQDTQSAQKITEIAKYTKNTSFSLKDDDSNVQIQRITSEVDNFRSQQAQKSIFKQYPSFSQGNFLDETYGNEVNLHPNVSYHDQKLDHSNIALDQQKKPSSSSTKKEENEMEDKQKQKHNKILAKMMTQRGMKQGKVSIQASAMSSSRSSSSYAGFFLKDIILRAKIPSAAKYYILIMALFFTSFLTLNITNYLIIQSDMSIFATNTEILKYPRKFLRAYSKVMFGYYLELEMSINYLLDTPDQQYQKIAADYKLTGKQLYQSLIATQSTSMIQQGQILAAQTGEAYEDFRVFMLHQNQDMTISRELEFSTHFYFLLALQSDYPSQINEDAFMYLRQNYFQFSSNILEMVEYLVGIVLTALDNLILKFLIVIICAICGIILVAFLSLPVIKAINKYEEKIIMTVTRIDLQQSETEKAKLEICKQLVSVDHIDWLSYNYFDVFATRTEKQQDMEEKREKNGEKQLNIRVQKSPKIEINKTSDQLIGDNSKNERVIQIDYSSNIVGQSNNLLSQSNNLLGQSSNMMESSINKKYQNNQKFNKFQKQTKESENPIAAAGVNVSRDTEHHEIDLPVNQNKRSNNASRKTNSNTTTTTTKKSNYLLQSRFGIQSLNVFTRFLVMLFLASLTSAFFLAVIIYLTSSQDNLKVPVKINQGSINLHIISINLRISTELLVFDYFLRDNLWSDYSITDLEEFYTQMKSSLEQIETIQKTNTQILYGSNPFPTATLDQFKDIQEGRACKYLTSYPCSSEGENLGVRIVVAEKEKIIVKYSSLLTPDKSDEADLREYLNSDDHIQQFVKSFTSEDEMLDQYSSLINESISTVSYSIQYFIQDYLLIGGTLCSAFILLVIIMNWMSVRNRLQRMNLLLSIIPEEKLSEEATLYMIKQLHKM